MERQSAIDLVNRLYIKTTCRGLARIGAARYSRALVIYHRYASVVWA